MVTQEPTQSQVGVTDGRPARASSLLLRIPVWVGFHVCPRDHCLVVASGRAGQVGKGRAL